MATAHTLRYRLGLWAGLRRGCPVSSVARQIRYTGQAAAAAAIQQTNNETAEIISSFRGGSSDTVAWYKPRVERRETPLRDVDYYAKLEHYPRKEQYEHLEEELFKLPPSAEVVSAVTNHLSSRGYLDMRQELVQRPEHLFWRYNLTFRFGEHRMQIAGEGLTTDASIAAAFMGFMYRLHAFGWLKRVFEQEGVQEKLNTRHCELLWSTEDVAAKMHIHNFAARYLVTPKVAFEKITDGQIRAKVVIPSTNYQTSVLADNPKTAEFLAYADLKDKIATELAAQQAIIDLQDNKFVNLDNAPALMKAFTIRQKLGKFRKMTKEVQGPGTSTWISKSIYWDGRPFSGSHEMPTHEDAYKLAALDTAVRLVRQDPALLDSYIHQYQLTGHFQPQRSSPAFASLSPDVVQTIEDCLELTSAKDEIFEPHLKPYPVGAKPAVFHGHQTNGSLDENVYESVAQSPASRSEELRQEHEMARHDPQVVDAILRREQLPVYQHKAQIIALVKNHDQCIVVGSTGSGKSTQVPQIIFDDAVGEGRGALCNVICTQPRRVSSVSLALTVCNERNRSLGDIVGYRIGGDYYNSSKGGGSITFCTTELLANELERAEEALPHDVSHIIIDEVHERSTNLDRLLAVVKLTFSKRMELGLRIPKLVLMSATVESDLFERYFEMVSQAGTVIRPPYLQIPGRQFQTETKFLDDFENQLAPEIYKHGALAKFADSKVRTQTNNAILQRNPQNANQVVRWESASETSQRGLLTSNTIDAIAATVIHIIETTANDGAILVFLPGANEIRLLHQALLKQKRLALDGDSFELLMLHRFNPAHLVRALEPTANGVRRIMLSTNIAESSITFPDVEYVVDSGLQRKAGDAPVGALEMLEDEHISRANILQRAGRAGRTKPGQYYGVLTTAQLQSLTSFPNAHNITIEQIQQIYLKGRIHFPTVPVQELFNSFLTPVPAARVQIAEKRLRNLGALTPAGEVTTIGYALYRTTLPPSLGRMILLGIVFRCVDRAVILATLLSMKTPIFREVDFQETSPADRRATSERFSQGSRSDIIAQMHAFEEYQTYALEDTPAAEAWATSEGISYQHFEQLHKRVEATRRVLYKAGFFRHRGSMLEMNKNHENITVLKLIIGSGLYPSVAAHVRGTKFLTHQALLVAPSPSSIALPDTFRKRGEEKRKVLEVYEGSIFCYRRIFSSKSGSQSYHMGDLTPISPIMLALLSPNVQAVDDVHNRLLIDDSMPLQFSGDPAAARTFLDFKNIWDAALLSSLQRVAETWGADHQKLYDRGLTDLILGAVQELLEYEDGQAQRRGADVNKFTLGNERDDAAQVIDTITHIQNQVGASTWRPPAAGDLEAEAPSAAEDSDSLVCSICGHEGHVYDDCPQSRTAARPRKLDIGPRAQRSSRESPVTPWQATMMDESEGEAWAPPAYEPTTSNSEFHTEVEEDKEGLSELPSEIDHQ